MNLNPRWQKVMRDIISNKTRTVLVVLSIAVGIAAIGLVTGSHVVMSNDLPTAYAAINPAHARIGLSTFDDTLVKAIEGMPAVASLLPARGASRITMSEVLAYE